jgi:RNA polymerase sigma-70 factor (ECF subfamily)
MGRPAEALEVQELYATIAKLPEDFRLALVAVDVLGLSYREAARALRVREATLTTRLFRARKQVVKRLEPEPSPSPTSPSLSRREEKNAGGVLSGEGAQ